MSWRPSPSPDTESYRIYRSVAGKPFEWVASQRVGWNRYEDFVGPVGVRAAYRIAAVDPAGNESPVTPAVAAQTHAMTDDQLMTMIQEAQFRYYWDGAHPKAGMGVEITPGNPDQVAMGGSGFGVMALIVGTDRGFVTRDQGAERMLKIVRFLKSADRFHGVWPHFLNGNTGKVMPVFGKYDDGGDLIETAFMMQGLLTARQYFTRNTAAEREIRDTITSLWRAVEWDWYRQRPDSDFLYWHWSPDYGFYITTRWWGGMNWRSPTSSASPLRHTPSLPVCGIAAGRAPRRGRSSTARTGAAPPMATISSWPQLLRL